MTQDILSDLARVKAIFQLRTLEMVIRGPLDLTPYETDAFGIEDSLSERKRLRKAGYARPYKLRRFLADESGASAVEWALIIAIVAAAMAFAAIGLKDTVRNAGEPVEACR
jgi:Flp pilus assembly pilin Flp